MRARGAVVQGSDAEAPRRGLKGRHFPTAERSPQTARKAAPIVASSPGDSPVEIDTFRQEAWRGLERALSRAGVRGQAANRGFFAYPLHRACLTFETEYSPCESPV